MAEKNLTVEVVVVAMVVVVVKVDVLLASTSVDKLVEVTTTVDCEREKKSSQRIASQHCI